MIIVYKTTFNGSIKKTLLMNIYVRITFLIFFKPNKGFSPKQ